MELAGGGKRSEAIFPAACDRNNSARSPLGLWLFLNCARPRLVHAKRPASTRVRLEKASPITVILAASRRTQFSAGHNNQKIKLVGKAVLNLPPKLLKIR